MAISRMQQELQMLVRYKLVTVQAKVADIIL